MSHRLDTTLLSAADFLKSPRGFCSLRSLPQSHNNKMAEPNKKRRLSGDGGSNSDPNVDAPKMEKTEANSPQKSTSTSQPRRTLFVRSLAPSITTEKLAEYFSQSYIVKHAIVVTDSETKQSKGYGFVTFADIEDAQGALEEFNKSELDGKKIKVEYAEPRHREVDEDLGKSLPSSSTALKQKRKEEMEQRRAAMQPPKLIVRNLPWSIKEPDDLAALFRSFGKIKQATLPKKGTKLAGFGFVVLRGKKNAEKALEAVNGKEVDGRTLAVDWAVEKGVWENLKNSAVEEAGSEKGDEEEKPENEGEEEEDGSDVDMEDASSNDEDASDDDEEMEDGDEEEDDDDDEEDERNASTIFIRNLPFTCTDEMLYDHFSQFGRLRYARIVVDPETERPRGTGFVCFVNAEDAASCVRGAPEQTDPAAKEKDKKSKGSLAHKQSILQNETADPTGRYTLDGRVLLVARAVSRKQAAKLEEEGVSRRLVRDKDKRRLFLLSEGTIPSNSPLYQKLSPTEIKMREDSFKQRQNFIKKNPTLHLSLTRLSIRNIPRHVSSKDLKALAREAVVGFAKDVTAGLRQPLSQEEITRSADEMREAEKERKQKGKGIVRQAKVVFESREGSKVNEKSGAGRSRGYGFIEYYTHRHALMGLRWLNGHAVKPPTTPIDGATEKTKRLIVEFAIENAQVIKRRKEAEAKARSHEKGSRNKDVRDKSSATRDDASMSPARGKKRKRSEASSDGKKVNGEEGGLEERNKVAKRNRIIAKKRMQRKARKGKA